MRFLRLRGIEFEGKCWWFVHAYNPTDFPGLPPTLLRPTCSRSLINAKQSPPPTDVIRRRRGRCMARATRATEREQTATGKSPAVAKEPCIAHITHASHARHFATLAHAALLYGTYASTDRRKRKRSLYEPKLRPSIVEIATEA